MSKLAIKATSKFKKDYKTAIKRGIKTMCKVMEELRNSGLKEGIEQGMELMDKLYSLGCTEDAKRAKTDPQYRAQLMKELAIQ